MSKLTPEQAVKDAEKKFGRKYVMGGTSLEEDIKAHSALWDKLLKKQSEPSRITYTLRFQLGAVYQHTLIKGLLMLVRNNPTHRYYGVYMNVVWCDAEKPLRFEDDVCIPPHAVDDWSPVRAGL